ncbi:MAG TPA: fimbria/pilus periplasmic chaperone [Gemmatimonadaceae bacterium]|nr:fimbria/pilus periplasmic chaperone [Gemmatimonadaceae bacterium]
MRNSALALCAVMGLASHRIEAQLLVDPLEVTIITAGGNRAVGSFLATNTSDVPVQATITRADWDRIENGDNRFLPAGSTGFSCGSSLSVSPASIRVDPHTSRVIRLSVDSVANLKKECWDIVFVEEVPPRTTLKGNSIRYLFRTGVKVYVAPSGLSRDAAVEDMAVETVPLVASASSTPPSGPRPTKQQIAVRFHNTGGMHLVAKGHLEFRRLDNTLAMQVPIDEFPTLPGATRKVMIDVPTGLATGDYVVLALIDFGGAELVAGQIDYQAK